MPAETSMHVTLKMNIPMDPLRRAFASRNPEDFGVALALLEGQAKRAAGQFLADLLKQWDHE